MKTKNNVLKVQFYIKKNEADTIGNCPLMGRITIGQSMVQFSLKCNFGSNLWDTRNGKASGKSKSALELNNKLDKIRISINNDYRILREHKGPDISITAHEIKMPFRESPVYSRQSLNSLIPITKNFKNALVSTDKPPPYSNTKYH